jgi:uncharacterized protein (UPF0335 family)
MTNTDKRLESIVARLVRLHQDRAHLGEDIRDLMKEATSAGYDGPGLRLVIKSLLESSDKRTKREAAMESAETMMAALGALVDSPLGEAAVARETRRHTA